MACSLDDGLLWAIPKSLSVESVVLDGNRVDYGVYLKTTFLEHHDTGVVDAGSLRKY